MRDTGDDATCGLFARFQHIWHVLEGYRAGVRDDRDNPYTPGSARASSWSKGRDLYQSDSNRR